MSPVPASFFVPTFLATFTEGETMAVVIALKRSLRDYQSQGYDIGAAPAGSTIGAQRDVLAGLKAIQLGNRRGSDKYQIKMARATPAPARFKGYDAEGLAIYSNVDLSW